MKHIYALSVSATRNYMSHNHPAVAYAHTENEAYQKGLTMILEKYKPSDGWVDHKCAVTQVPDEGVISIAEGLNDTN